MSRPRVAGFVVAWDIDGEHSPVLPTYVDAVLAIVEAERSTAGNVTGTIYAVAAAPYKPTRAEWNAAEEAVYADKILRGAS